MSSSKGHSLGRRMNLPIVRPPPVVGHRGTRDCRVHVRDAITGSVHEEKVYLIRDHEPDRAYYLIPEKKGPKLLHGTGFVCVVFKRRREMNDGVGGGGGGRPIFQQPLDGGADTLVFVKELKLRSLCHSKRDGLNTMKLIGDNRHVLACEDVLQDNRFLYVITPYCDGGDFFECLPWTVGVGMRENHARRYFEQILDCLSYLRERRICNRNLCPENIRIHRGRCLIIDFDYALHVPYVGDNPVLIEPQCRPKNGRYMAPELHANLPFDGYAVDLWSAGIILYSMLAGDHLFDFPNKSDICYDFFILAGGLSNDPINARTIKLMQGWSSDVSLRDMNIRLSQRQWLHEKFSVDARDLLYGMLRPDPEDRLTLDNVKNHRWFK